MKAVKEKRVIFIVEGEKDCHTLEQYGQIATTSPMGAGKWKDEYSEYFRGSEIINILPAETLRKRNWP